MSSPLRNPRYQIMLTVAILTGGLFYAWWVTRYEPQLDDIASLAAHEAQLRVANQKARQDLYRIGIPKIDSALKAYTAQMAQVMQLVPSDSGLAPLLPMVTALAPEYGVRIDKTAPAVRARQGEYTTEEIPFTVAGRYHDVGAFLTRLLTLDRITQLREVRLCAVDLTGPTESGLTTAAPSRPGAPARPAPGGGSLNCLTLDRVVATPASNVGVGAQVRLVAFATGRPAPVEPQVDTPPAGRPATPSTTRPPRKRPVLLDDDDTPVKGATDEDID